MTYPRLSLSTLDGHVRGLVTGPLVDPATVRTGIVHLGVGAFHRTHQAVFTEDAAAATGDDRWGILGVTPRTRRVVDQLEPQDGLYGVLTKGADATSLRVVGSMRGVAFLRADPRVITAIAAPTTHVVTLTVSEKGYRRTADGRPDLTDRDVAADVALLGREVAGTLPRGADDVPARTPIGALARGLVRRLVTADGAPLTVVSCDNLVGNGEVVAALVAGLLEAVPGTTAVREWLATSVTFPSTMVDRITPATTGAHRVEAAELLGLRDEALVVAEPFRQWVLEDRFAGPRPAWERAGATLTADVGPFERAKLRLLNGTHSTVAYLGALHGYGTVHEAMADPDVADVARQLQAEVRRTLDEPEGLDLAAYSAQILERFANPAIGYPNLQVASDGSQKLPQRVLGTVADLLADGVVPPAATRAVAAWAVFAARGRDRAGRALPLDDPLADTLRAAAAGGDVGLADRMLGVAAVFPADIAGHDGFRAAFRTEVAALLRQVP